MEMPQLIQAVHEKVRTFVLNSDHFRRVCDSAFDALDTSSAGYVTPQQAASGVQAFFRELQTACTEYGIVLEPLTPDEVLQLFRESDGDANSRLSPAEFQDFYARVLTYAAARACTGFGRKYGVAMLGGIVGVAAAKGVVRRLPLVGWLAAPILGLFPAVLVGPLLGVAVVYGIDQRDLFAIRHKLFPPKQGPMRK
ncbi:hypothetical protein Agub_g8537 [Astrephomene gubernaculifera]|uniref:EF-hand domain-containing protein n=1 Tax=Astrephomene gubernaculifera TaxID=47775 RepID=A0AAD3HN88_9CHLO|nr:hypothetical protein Agub_g8537 [Astrephomene gubernaculifera]